MLDGLRRRRDRNWANRRRRRLLVERVQTLKALEGSCENDSLFDAERSAGNCWESLWWVQKLELVQSLAPTAPTDHPSGGTGRNFDGAPITRDMPA